MLEFCGMTWSMCLQERGVAMKPALPEGRCGGMGLASQPD
ncbi:hypothetical protein TOK_2248 [Pseudonocardia sp. N23]|nr:hypothetical protein TOK_2248 [Pseudonocardia sp. N23]